MPEDGTENFDRVWERDYTDSVKWRGASRKFGRDVLPMWVADMDFPVADCITGALSRRIAHPIYGYPDHDLEVQESAARWLGQRYQWFPDPADLLLIHGVLPGLFAAVQAFTEPGDAIAVLSPVYPPFYEAAENGQRRLVRVPLVEDGHGWYRMNFLQLEKVLPQVRMLLLCSPHNPVGRVWTREELEHLVRLCSQHGVQIVSDEIHADLAGENPPHTPLPMIDGGCIYLGSATKSFNIAGIGGAFAWAGGSGKKNHYLAQLRRCRTLGMNTLAKTASQAAWDGGAGWIHALQEYLRQNAGYLDSFLRESLPGIRFRPPEFGYLAWLDLRALGLSDAAVASRLLSAGLGLNLGPDFGPEGSGFVRLNYGTPAPVLRQGMALLGKAFGQD